MKRILFMATWLLFLAIPLFSGALGTTDTATYCMKHSYDVLNYKLSLDIYGCFTSPYPDSFTAKEEIAFRVDSALNAIRLNAVNSSMDIDSVRMAGVTFTHANDTLTVNLNRTYNPGEVVTVRISYRHKDANDHAFYATSGAVFTDCPRKAQESGSPAGTGLRIKPRPISRSRSQPAHALDPQDTLPIQP